MKSISISLISLFAFLNLFAQVDDNYLPFIEDNKIWIINICSWVGIEPSKYYLEADTIIDGNNYLKMYALNIGDSIRPVFVGSLREENSKVYLRPSEQIYFTDLHKDYLMYDFSLEEGETVTLPFFMLPDMSIDLRVTAIEHINVEGIQRKKWIFGDKDKPDEVWIEGIGSIRGIFQSGFVTVDLHTSLACVSKNDRLIYCNTEDKSVTFCLSSSCACTALINNIDNKPLLQNKTFFATPSIFKHQTQLRFSLPKSSNISLHIFNHQGQIITSLYDKEQLQMGEYQQSLSLPNVSSGIYYAVLLINGRRVATQKLVLMK